MLTDSASGFDTTRPCLVWGSVMTISRGSRTMTNSMGACCLLDILTDTPHVPPVSPRPHCVPKIYFSMVNAVLISNVHPDREPYERLEGCRSEFDGISFLCWVNIPTQWRIR